MGIGVVAIAANNQLLAEWAMVERGAKQKSHDEATSIRLALIKAKEQNYTRITVSIRDKNLLSSGHQ